MLASCGGEEAVAVMFIELCIHCEFGDVHRPPSAGWWGRSWLHVLAYTSRIRNSSPFSHRSKKPPHGGERSVATQRQPRLPASNHTTHPSSNDHYTVYPARTHQPCDSRCALITSLAAVRTPSAISPMPSLAIVAEDIALVIPHDRHIRVAE